MSCLVLSPAAGCVVVAMEVTPLSFIVQFLVLCNSVLVQTVILNFTPSPRAAPSILFPPFARREDTPQEDVAHFAGNVFCVGVDARVVPSVNPIHHAKQAEHSDAAGKLQTAFPFQVFEQTEANPVILALDGGEVGSETILQNLGFVGQDFHRGLVGKKILEMIENENTNAMLGILHSFKALFQPLHDG